MDDSAPHRQWHRRLIAVWERTGWSKVELARRAEVDKERVYKYLSGNVEQPRGDMLDRLATALGVNGLWLRAGIGPESSLIPVVGYLSAGEAWEPVDDYAQGGGMDTVQFSPDFTDPIAIRVRGPSMSPVYRNGDALICSRLRGADRAQFLRRDCAVRTVSGNGYIKTVLAGARSGTFRLRSYNPEYPDIEDQRLEWAAPVIWIKRAP